MAVRKTFMVAVMVLGTAAQASAADKIVIGTVPNIGDGPLLCAIERGYFREQNLEVELTPFRTASEMTPMIVRGDIAIMGGGISVTTFNSVAQGMPIRYFANRTRSPAYHALVVRKDLADKITSVAQMKGLKIASTAVGGVSEYELSRTLEASGLTLDDVDVKVLGMPQTVAALKNGAVDAAVLVPPFDAAAIQDGARKITDADAAVHPRLEVSGLSLNSDWAAKNQPLLDRFALAYVKGTRCFYEAAKGGPNRDEVIDYYVKHSPIKDRQVYVDMMWSQPDPDAKVNVDSLLDQQEFFAKRGYIPKKAALADIVDTGPIDRALNVLGRYKE